MTFNAYYEDELSSLRELGRDFARANPKLAASLGEDASDPDVERLLEGFAFLAGRLRQKLDDEMPELLHGLLRLVWPQYLRPLPPATIVEFKAVGASEAVPVPAGVALASRPIEGVACRFRTCRDLSVLPFEITEVETESRPTGARLSLRVRATGQAPVGVLAGHAPMLHFHSEREPQSARSLLLWMTRHLGSVAATDERGRVVSIDRASVRAAGFDEAAAVFPYPQNGFGGFRHLQEYLAFPARFLFVQLSDLRALADLAGRSVSLVFEFTRPLPDRFRIGEDQIRLNCVPAVNLFAAEARPLKIDPVRRDYPVRPAGQGAAIYAIERVTGHQMSRSRPVDYPFFETFRHDPAPDGASLPFVREKIRPSITGRGIDHILTFVSGLDQPVSPAAETVTVALTCSNGDLAERIPVGAIDRPTAETPPNVTFANLLVPTAQIPPPISANLLWRVVSSLSRNYGTLADIEALRSLVASYDFQALRDARARRRLDLLLESLVGLETGVEDGILQGCPVRIRVIHVFVAESRIGGEAEMYLLGSVLQRVFEVYEGVNTLHRFVISGVETGAEYRWSPRAGTS